MIPFLKEVADDLVKRFGNNLQQIAIVFNNKRPEVYMHRYFAEIIKKPFWSPAFFTIQDFFKQGTPFVEADKISQIVVLHEGYTMLLAARGQQPLPIDRFFPIAETILSDFAQIDYDLVDPAMLYREIHDLAEIEKQFQFLTEEQVSFLEQFWKSFHQYGQEQLREKFIQLWKIMPDLYRYFHHSLGKEGKTTTAALYRTVATIPGADIPLIEPFQQLVFVGFNALNKAEGILFKKWQDQGKALFYFDADQYYVQDPLQEAGFFIRKNIQQLGLKNALGDFPEVLRNRQSTINLIEASGFIAQAKVLDGLLGENREQQPVAVLLADENLLIPVLQSIPTETLNITMGFPLKQSPLFGIIDLWLKTQEQYLLSKSYSIPHKDLESFLSHPAVQLPEADRVALLEQIKANQYVRVPYEVVYDYPQIGPFFKRTDHALDLIQTLDVLLKSLFTERNKQQQLSLVEISLLAQVLQELNSLYDSIQHYPTLQQANLHFIIAMIRKHFAGISAAIEGDPLQGVQIMGLLESRNLDFKEIYLVGANDGMLPKRSFGHTFIPDAIRRAYGLPVLENQEALSAYLFYRLLQRTEKITLIFNTLVDETSSGEVSRFVRQLRFESKFSFRLLKQQQKGGITPLSSPLVVPKTAMVAEKLNQYFQSDKLKISATAFTNYLQSPLLFFLKNLAQIREPDLLMEDFQVNKIGTVLHEVMQYFYQSLKDQDPHITLQRIEGRTKDLPELCLKALSNTFYHHPEKRKLADTNSIEKIILQITEDYARLILEEDKKTAPFNIIELENTEDYVINFPLSINGEEKWIRLQGIIDRVDEKDGVIRIVDYKTGSDDLEYGKDPALLFDATQRNFNKALIQTLFYTLIYEQKSGNRFVEPHLYAVRKLKDKGTLFYSNSFFLKGEKLEQLKTIFVSQLKQTLEELFNKDIPFQHRQGVDLPYLHFYSEFFEGISSEEPRNA